MSPSNESGSDVSHKFGEEKVIPVFDDNSNPGKPGRAHHSHEEIEREIGTPLSIRKPHEGFRISSSALRSIKQKIDSINANFDQATLKSAASKSIDRLKSSAHLSLSDPKNLDKGEQN